MAWVLVKQRDNFIYTYWSTESTSFCIEGQVYVLFDAVNIFEC
jgi:hypothetical protein